MHATLTHVDKTIMLVVIEAKAGPLRSHLTCQIIEETPDISTVTRTQEYPGIVGSLFKLIKGKREAKETREYLQAWISHAELLP